jgi:hypothetical protein
MAITRIGNPAIADQRGINFRNIIINGGMDLAQRSTSVSGITGSSYNTCDRWRVFLGSLGTWTQSQSTDVPSGQGFSTSLKMDCTTADASPSASGELIVAQSIEGQNLQYLKFGTSSAESLTVSFWVKSNKTGTYICELFHEEGSNDKTINKSYTIDSANTWEKKTITFAGDTAKAFDNDNALTLNLSFWLGAGSNFTSGTLATSWETRTNANRAVGQVNLADSTSNEWYITGVQLEAGQVASDFEFLPYDVNLERCKRYYQDSFSSDNSEYSSGTGSATNGAIVVGERYPTSMRATPTLTFISYNGTTGDWSNSANNSDTSSVTVNSSGRNGFHQLICSGLTTGQPYYGRYKADAEL